MESKVTVTTVYNCTLERAFKTPMLCDVSKVHTGVAGILPGVSHCTGDENWGKPGYSKNVFITGWLTQKGAPVFTDKVIERIENKYWKIEVGNFKMPMFGFTKCVGEWATTEIEPGKILITYTYTMHAHIALLYPLNWFITKTFWRIYMQRVLENIRQMIINNEPYLYP